MSQIMLVPLDGSPASEQALPYAQRIARATLAHVVPVRAAQAFTVPGTDPTKAQLAAIAEAQTYLDEQAARLSTIGLVTETAAMYGEAASVILNEVQVRKADVVVMATHGRAGPGRWLFGSVADEVLRSSPVPIILVPPGAASPWPTDRPLRILVPLDGSELGESVLETLDSFAARLGADVVLIQVVALPPYGLYAQGAEYLGTGPDAALMEAQRYLAEMSKRLQPTFQSVRVRAVIGQPVTAIALIATEERADLIAMATHGRSGLARLVLGSVTTGVLQRAGLPLFLVRPSALRHRVPAVASPEAVTAGRTIQVPLSLTALDLLQRGLGEVLYKPGADPELSLAVRELRYRMARTARATNTDVFA
jgi:nucleotide-binding universal stress UspA family protein